jgi:hypothetical protein
MQEEAADTAKEEQAALPPTQTSQAGPAAGGEQATAARGPSRSASPALKTPGKEKELGPKAGGSGDGSKGEKRSAGREGEGNGEAAVCPDAKRRRALGSGRGVPASDGATQGTLSVQCAQSPPAQGPASLSEDAAGAAEPPAAAGHAEAGPTGAAGELQAKAASKGGALAPSGNAVPVKRPSLAAAKALRMRKLLGAAVSPKVRLWHPSLGFHSHGTPCRFLKSCAPP